MTERPKQGVPGSSETLDDAVKSLIIGFLIDHDSESTLRLVGMHLAHSPPVQDNKEKSVLTEIKKKYGNLKAFISRYFAVFQVFASTSNDSEHDFTIRLKAPAGKDELDSTAMQRYLGIPESTKTLDISAKGLIIMFLTNHNAKSTLTAVGKHLILLPPLEDRTKKSVLGEIKTKHGNLKTFIERYADVFQIIPIKVTGYSDFMIRLKVPVDKYELGSTTMERSTQGVPGSSETLEDTAEGLIIDFLIDNNTESTLTAVGTHLKLLPPVEDRTEKSVLAELKTKNGNLKAFIERYADVFQMIPIKNYSDFMIRLKVPVDKYELGSTTIERSKQGTPEETKTLDDAAKGFIIEFLIDNNTESTLRLVGIHLKILPPVEDHTEKSVLSELKTKHGNVWTFVSRYSDVFKIIAIQNIDIDFTIRLTVTAVKDQLQRQRTQNLKSKELLGKHEKEMKPFKERLTNRQATKTLDDAAKSSIIDFLTDHDTTSTLRLVGIYLRELPPVEDRTEKSVLTELKTKHGNLKTFISRYTDVFQIITMKNIEIDFTIRLTVPAVKDELQRQRTQNLKSKELLGEHEKEMLLLKESATNRNFHPEESSGELEKFYKDLERGTLGPKLDNNDNKKKKNHWRYLIGDFLRENGGESTLGIIGQHLSQYTSRGPGTTVLVDLKETCGNLRAFVDESKSIFETSHSHVGHTNECKIRLKHDVSGLLPLAPGQDTKSNFTSATPTSENLEQKSKQVARLQRLVETCRNETVNIQRERDDALQAIENLKNVYYRTQQSEVSVQDQAEYQHLRRLVESSRKEMANMQRERDDALMATENLKTACYRIQQSEMSVQDQAAYQKTKFDEMQRALADVKEAHATEQQLRVNSELLVTKALRDKGRFENLWSQTADEKEAAIKKVAALEKELQQTQQSKDELVTIKILKKESDGEILKLRNQLDRRDDAGSGGGGKKNARLRGELEQTQKKLAREKARYNSLEQTRSQAREATSKSQNKPELKDWIGSKLPAGAPVRILKKTDFPSAPPEPTLVASIPPEPARDPQHHFDGAANEWRGGANEDKDRLDVELAFVSSSYGCDEITVEATKIVRLLRLEVEQKNEAVSVNLILTIPDGYPSLGAILVDAMLTEGTTCSPDVRKCALDAIPGLVELCRWEANGRADDEALLPVLATADKWVESDWVYLQAKRFPVTEEKKTDTTGGSIEICRQVIYTHHIKDPDKIQFITKKAAKLHLGGYIRTGKPGIILVEGLEQDCESFLEVLIQQRTKLRESTGKAVDTATFSEAGRSLASVENLDSDRSLPKKLEELNGREGMDIIRHECEKLNLEECLDEACKR